MVDSSDLSFCVINFNDALMIKLFKHFTVVLIFQATAATLISFVFCYAFVRYLKSSSHIVNSSVRLELQCNNINLIYDIQTIYKELT